jgi:hypothetical protein
MKFIALLTTLSVFNVCKCLKFASVTLYYIKFCCIFLTTYINKAAYLRFMINLCINIYALFLFIEFISNFIQVSYIAFKYEIIAIS